VLVVLRDDAAVGRRFRRSLWNRRAADSQVTVVTNAEVVCVDGASEVEAVVIRYAGTGRLLAVNTDAFLACGV